MAKGKMAPAKWLKNRTRVPGSKKIVNELLPGFSRQFGAMMSAGMPIVSALEAQEEQADHPNFKIVIRQVRLAIENGASLSEAMRQFPSIFDDLFCNMIKGGESGGQIAETIQRLAGFLESSSRLRRKVKSAMMYPTIVLCIALALAVAMIVFIVPVFGSMFSDFGAELPGPTRVLMNVSNKVRDYGLYLLVIVVGAVIGFKKWKATPHGAYSFDSFVLKTPVFGELTRKVASARFARSLGEMIRSGVPILSALDIVAGATGNLVTGRIVKQLRKSVEVGEPLSSAMANQTVFPLMLYRMLQAGEKTGRIDEMMDSIADFYDDEVETMLSGLTSLLEPLLMVFLGVVIGGIVLCMFLPIFKMGEIVSR
ncbi:MAG: type II secretion system F family protein [Lentisphaerae bacterium]|nr:type II secretion system F family protein [Lentisphaerota bacterium]